MYGSYGAMESSLRGMVAMVQRDEHEAVDESELEGEDDDAPSRTHAPSLAFYLCFHLPHLFATWQCSSATSRCCCCNSA